MLNGLESLELEASGNGDTVMPSSPGTVEGILAQAEAAGYPDSALKTLRSHAELVKRTAMIAKIDVNTEAQYVYEHLPELRRTRAATERELAAKGSAEERKTRLERAARLEDQANKLTAPSANDREKARALATELSIRLASQLRNIQVSTPDVDPAGLQLFERTFHDHAQGVAAQTGASKAQAQHAARLAFLQAMTETDTTPDDPTGLHAAIVRYRKNTTQDFGAEPGHLHDVPLSEVSENATGITPDRLSRMAEREEHDRAAEVVRLSRALTLAAATELNLRQYAIFQVMAENTHLFDWKIENDRLLFQKREGSEKGENIASLVMDQVGGFSGKGAAYRAVHVTLDRLGEALQKYGRNVAIEDIPSGKRTQALDRLTTSREQVMEAARSERIPTRRQHQAREDVEME
ncbi:hypothetical protein HFQ13_09635 [Acidithiobacillus sp. VAN18-1]|uniref:Uncharacterized protein n=1 Tax=Igneacidithiobacillus copahuensis TaxID=2724909 RepID=A0AAE2YR74_9PROT|nr:hypothetical protein [Igneacidithiobacillus copahuensis]MBU2788453.1 hypothetical protein [Igneacidithiobacillus copahuensis]MBU2796907.1 hypothetical protein [Acidithiobacillus sp. VAN18-2]